MLSARCVPAPTVYRDPWSPFPPLRALFVVLDSTTEERKMSKLEAFLDHWVIYRKDNGEYVINGKYEDFYKALETFIKQRDYL